MPKAPVYNQKGEKIGVVNLPDNIFNVPYNANLILQVLRIFQSRKRNPLAHTKDRSEVRGGGKKPWRQKGTGRARHGSRRSPLWKGGGVTFGPRKERNFMLVLPRKMKTKALCSVLSQKLKDDEIKIVENINPPESKTKAMEDILKNLLPASKKYRYQRAIVAVPQQDVALFRATRNLPYVFPLEIRQLNAYDLLQYRYLILPKESIRVLEETVTKATLK